MSPPWLVNGSIKAWEFGFRIGRAALLPGSFLAGAVAIAAATGAVLRQNEVPDAQYWRIGGDPSLALTALVALAGMFQFLLAAGFGRKLRVDEKTHRLEEVCRDVLRFVSEGSPRRRGGSPRLNYTNLAAHAWLVRGPRWAKYLRRGVFLIPRERSPSNVVWTREKGALGNAWAEEAAQVYDLEPLVDFAEDDPAGFDELDAEERLHMTADEVKTTSDYKAIWAAPIFGGPSANRRVVGCISVDVVAEEDAADALKAATRLHRKPGTQTPVNEGLKDTLAAANSIF